MVSLELNVATFKSQWQFCDRITEYLSDILGQGHSDPARYSNFLSVAANELIELAFRSTREPGRISFSLYRGATSNRLRIAFAREDRESTGMDRLCCEAVRLRNLSAEKVVSEIVATLMPSSAIGALPIRVISTSLRPTIG